MRVSVAAEYMQLTVHAASERALRQHALDRNLDRALRMLLEQFVERGALQIADVARVLVIPLVGELRARDAHRAGVDHDDVIAEILVRSVRGLVLALQAMGDLRGQPAQGLAPRIDDIPVAAGFFGLCEYGLHG